MMLQVQKLTTTTISLSDNRWLQALEAYACYHRSKTRLVQWVHIITTLHYIHRFYLNTLASHNFF